MFSLAERLRRQNHDVLWLAFRLVWVCMCMHVCVCWCPCICMCVCVWDIFLNHVKMLWTILCLFHPGQYWHGSCLVLSLSLDPLFPDPCLRSIPPMADMGLLSRLLFILLHDWNYTSLMNHRVNPIHPDHWVEYVCCVWVIVRKSVFLLLLRLLCGLRLYSLPMFPYC